MVVGQLGKIPGNKGPSTNFKKGAREGRSGVPKSSSHSTDWPVRLRIGSQEGFWP